MNELRRQVYMSTLGIDSYMPRWRLPLAPEPFKCSIPLVDDSFNNADYLIEDVTSSEVIGKEKSSITHENTLVVADVLRHLIRDGAPSVSPSVISEVPFVKEKQQKIAPFDLSIWRPIENILIIDSRDSRLAFPTELLLKNILQAIVGLTSIGKEDVMRWPMVENALVPQSEASLRNALEVWMEVELERRPAKKILLMGSNASRYFLPVETNYSELLWRAIDLNQFSTKVVIAPALVELLQNPLLKRDLWQSLQLWIEQ